MFPMFYFFLVFMFSVFHVSLKLTSIATSLFEIHKSRVSDQFKFPQVWLFLHMASIIVRACKTSAMFYKRGDICIPIHGMYNKTMGPMVHISNIFPIYGMV